jgi:hypothetical protein
MNGLEERVVGVLEALDEAGNAAIGPDQNIPLAGNPHATISQRLGQMMVYGNPDQKRIAHAADQILTWVQNNVFEIPTDSHCLDSIKDFPTALPSAG